MVKVRTPCMVTMFLIALVFSLDITSQSNSTREHKMVECDVKERKSKNVNIDLEKGKKEE